MAYKKKEDGNQEANRRVSGARDATVYLTDGKDRGEEA